MSGGGGGAQQAVHSLAFRVMRLCRPTLHVDTAPLKFDPCDILFGEDLFDDPIAASHLPRLLSSQSNTSVSDPSDLSYRSRYLLHHPTDSLGFPGLLVLPQAFGAIYLGETFCSYISINNSSNFEVRDVIIKTENSAFGYIKNPVESIRAGGRYDFIVEHDVKELGAHTLVCTALYSDGDSERKYLPQFFKFIVSNPLSVRTKVRNVKITWRTNLGEPGRLQTQHIVGNPITRKEIELDAVEIPPSIILDKPFLVSLKLTNLTERVLGPFEVWLSESDLLSEKAVMVNGLQTMTLGEAQAFSSLNFQLNLIATKHGIQKISGITVFDTVEKKNLQLASRARDICGFTVIDWLVNVVALKRLIAIAYFESGKESLLHIECSNYLRQPSAPTQNS
ncbi:UNVERIFIED_CONTAM: putative trafficking protein particle complex subunit [Sesamum radiatum]|uniref:Trafficking protein particle complex subunit n=1 Tax=Sesamum radiatum TaxID=300843 RepID=A0AAW2LPW0_SESRA